METTQPLIQMYIKILLVLFFVTGISSCKGLDDWSNFKSVGDLLDDQEDAKADTEFIRYGEVGMSTQPVVEFLIDNSAVQSKIYSKHIQKSCDYTKMPFKTTAIQSFIKQTATTRCVVLLDSRKLSNAAIENLLEFVSNGGTLFIPFAVEDHRMAFLYGFRPEAEFDTDAKSAGYRFTTPMLPTMKGMTMYDSIQFFGFAGQNFSKNIKILATARNNPAYPAVVENTIGKGKVLLYNTSVYISKQDRGFLFAGVLKGLEGIPYPIANVSTIFLDDFPSPLYSIKAEPIASELNLTMSDYVTKIWWPDMIKIAKEFDLRYSAMIAFDYKNKVVPPFVFDQWNSTKIKTKDKVEPISDWLMRDVKKHGHELAFHGYNHVELTVKDWKNQEFIQLALKSVKKKWDAGNFGPMPKTYVPPSNIIDDKGLIELKKAMPSLKYMCSLWLGETEEGGNREFDYDPFNKELFDFPRISSGFYLNNEEKYVLHSEYLITGVWNHFVHPDDVYQIPASASASAGNFDLRNKLAYGWYKTKGKDKAMFPEFRKYLREMTTAFPQLRFVTGGAGGKFTIDWRASRYSHKAENGLYTVEETNLNGTKQYWFMYGSLQYADKIETQLKNQTVLYSKTPFMDGYLYSSYTNKKKLISIDLLYKTPEQEKDQLHITQTVTSDYLKYKDLVKKFATGALWVDNSEIKFKQEIAGLKKKMLNETQIDSVIWNRYAKYRSWEGKGDEVWKMFDEYVKKYPTVENIMYSKELDRVIGYPNEIAMEKWMSEQLVISPNDKELLKNYIVNFNTEENQFKIKNTLKILAILDRTAENYKHYIQHLLQYYPDEAREVLADRKPSGEFGEEIATTIVWLYADQNDFKKAYGWSKFSTEIDFTTKMNWLIELKDYKQLEKEYLFYIAEHPEDYKTKALMAGVYHEFGRFKDSWVLANSLPEDEEKEALRKMLNTDVAFEKPDLQLDLAANHSELFYLNVLKGILKEDRLLRSNYIDLVSTLETNQDNPAVFKNRGSYNFRNKKGNIHSLGIAYSQYYKQEINDTYPNNTDNSLKGLEYKYATGEENPEVEGKIQYWSRVRFEFDDRNKLFYQFGAGISRSRNKSFTSAGFNIFPTETGPAVNQGIYQMRLNLYKDFYLFRMINASVSLEGNYYTNGLLSIDTVTVIPDMDQEEDRPINLFSRRVVEEPIDENSTKVTTFDGAIEGAATVRLALDNGDDKKSKFIPYLEGQYSRGTLDQSVGYPYWMIKERLYGGGGLGWNYGLGDFKTSLEAGYFLDDYSKNFQRYSGNVSYQLFDYTALTLNFELFSQDKYYSNNFMLGIKYNLKKKLRKNK